MKKINLVLLTGGLTFITANSFAQTTTTSASQTKNADAIAQQMTGAIKQTVTGVTPDQEKQIYAAEQDYANGVLDVKSTTTSNMSSNDKMAKYNQIQAFAQTRDAKIKTILTADQYTQYQRISPPMPAMGAVPAK
jgi:ABC-type transporter MlaC component